MTDNKPPKIEPIKLQEYQTKQSKYPMVPRLPMRSIILGPSGSGKTVLIQNMILELYRGCFSRIYIFSPSIEVDATWSPVKQYIEKEMKVQHTEKEPIYFEHYNPEDLENIIHTQHKVIEFQKKQGHKKLYSILIIVDDHADDARFSRNSPLLNSLFVRGRHNSISTLVGTQKFNAISPLIRVNAAELFVYRLRNYKDLETLVEETSAIVGGDKKLILQIYNLATAEPYSFLYINLRSKDRNDIFHVKFDKRIEID